MGRALGRRLRELGWKIGAVVTQQRAQRAQSRAFHRCGTRACVSDASGACCAGYLDHHAGPRRTSDVAEDLARIGAEELRGKIVLHTSGALELGRSRAGETLRCFRWVDASAADVQRSGSAARSTERVFAIEGDIAAVRMARQIARALGAVPVHIDGAKKPLYHAAGALAAGNVLALMEAATR